MIVKDEFPYNNESNKSEMVKSNEAYLIFTS